MFLSVSVRSSTFPRRRISPCRGSVEGFAARATPLCALLGQMIGPIKPSVGECWSGPRQLDNLLRGSPFVGHKVQHLTSSRLPLPAARILSGSVPSAYWIWSAKGRSHTILERNADATVLHLNSNLSVGLGFSSLGNSNDDLAFACEFQGVADQVGQDLAHPPRIPAQSGWDAALIALASSMSFARVSLAHNSKVLSTKSLMIVSSASPLARIISAYSRCCGARSPSRNKPVIPITRSSGYVSRGSSDSDHGDQGTYH